MSQHTEANEDRILHTWHANARPWARAIEAGSIASRKLVTDGAIVAAVAGTGAHRVLDVGCGEGWLARALNAEGMAVTGVDAVAELIAEAQRHGGGDFHVQDYRGLATRQWSGGSFDAAVCNFSLLGNESVPSLLEGLGAYLGEAGWLIVQTLHPVAACGSHPYRDGWREGSWAGFSAEFSDPAPWYFRTLGSWLAMLRRCGFDLLECREPTAPAANSPASVIFLCKIRRAGQTAGDRGSRGERT